MKEFLYREQLEEKTTADARLAVKKEVTALVQVRNVGGINRGKGG